MKIYINAGHDVDLDPGAVNPVTGLKEADVCKDIALQVCGYLEHVGYKTMFGQSDALTRDIINAANDWEADLFVSIHCNSFSNPQANGIETLVYPGSTNSAKLANCIQNQLVKTLQLTDRGVKERSDLGVLRETYMPAVLTEIAFISNDKEEKILASAGGRNTIAAAIARGVTDYYAN